ncbi:unnamed protein product [Mytilus coruscus]|uniref:SRCR domain-containing protein n=1 Tax=Mytilus coruscus TaxID=42192 RepID=A0A6J8DMS3_MYTCO|nr:unnamed protein product [Mytilus coruscus]
MNTIGYHRIFYNYAISINCQGGIRLSNYDHLEILIDKKWGTVCDDKFDVNAAMIVCRQLGFLWQKAAVITTHTIANCSIPIHLDDINCDGSEDNVLKCRMNTFGMHDCSHTEDISVKCQGYSSQGGLPIRLSNYDHGRLEILIYKRWGTVWDDNFTVNAAIVLTSKNDDKEKQKSNITTHIVADDIVPIYLDEINCKETEDNLLKCRMNTIGIHDCSSDEDISVECQVNITCKM